MNFKRLVSGVCAFSIAVTQTAIVPISVSAVDYISVPNFTDQFKVGGSVNSTTGKNTWDHDAWDGLPEDVAPSAKQFITDKTTIATTETPDESKDVQFTFSTVIDDGYYQGGDEFDFTVYDLTVTLTKDVGKEVAESVKSVSNGGVLLSDSPITVGSFADAIDGSRITVTYTVDSADDAALDIVDANDASLSGGAAFDASATTFEATLDETTAKTVAENGFKLSGNGITVTDVSITVPAHKISDPVTEILSNAKDYSWTLKRNNGGLFEGNLTFVPEEITIDNFKDFVDNCSIKYEWSDIECTASRRASFESVNAELWSGSSDLGDWNRDNRVVLPAFDKAEKFSRLVIEYTVNDPNSETDPVICVADGTNGNIPNIYPGQFEPSEDGRDGYGIPLPKDAGSITLILTEDAAKSLKNGAMYIHGTNVTLTAVRSLEADMSLIVSLNETNFPNATFREFVEGKCDVDGDKLLTPAELGKVEDINLSKPDKNNSDQTYADDKYRQIDNFKGIEYFTNLRGVNIGGNTAVTSIDLSGCTKLTDFVGANCPKLEKAVLSEGVKEVYIYISGLKEFDAAKYPKLEILKIFNTQVTSIDVSKNPNLKELDLSDDKLTSGIDVTNCPELTYLNVNRTGISKLDVSKNTKLEKLYISVNDGIELVGLDKLSSLLSLEADHCGLTKIDVSKNTNLEFLKIGSNSIAAIDLTGLDRLTALSGAHQICYINLISNTFDLTQLSYCGFDISRMTLSEENKGVTLSGNVLTFDENTEGVNYIYDTGIEDKPLYVKLKVTERLESNFTVSYVENDKTVTVAADKWEDVLKAMNNKNTDYVVYLNNDVTIKKLTFPTAAKAKSIAVYNPSGKTITTDASSITLPIDTTFDNISIESTAKTFTITASKNLDISDFRSEKLKTLKGGAKSVLTFNAGAHNTVKADISGFGTIAFDKCTEAELLGTVKATTLKLNDSATVIVKNNSVTFTNIEIAGEEAIMTSICYGDDNFKPITVTGNITAENNASKIRIYKRVEKNIVSFSAEQTVLTAKTASFANVEVFENSMPEGEINYTLARVGSDIKLLAEKLKVVTFYEEGGMNETVYAQWSDVLSTIAANAKAGQKDNEYHVTLLDDYNMNGVFKMPAAKTYSSLNLSSEQSVKTITFTGNITLTGFTIFNNIKLDAQKKSGKEFKPTDFTIAAGRNSLQLEYVKANIKSITSSDEVQLTGTTVGAVTANSVMVWANSESEMLGYAAMGAAWDGKTAPTTTVNITGNLTVKKLLELENNSSLSVGGILNAGEIFALDDTVLVVKQQAKGKKALVIGKSGFDNNSGKINFVLVDPKTEKTAEITEDLILGTIAGPYADQLVPSNDNLTEADSYYIIKDGKNLIAKPKATAGLVTVEVNGNKAYYKSLDDAIKEISATGSKGDNVVIYLTQDMFSKPIAKLPLPSAGKYDRLTLKADSDVTINITGDIALTGNLSVEDKISINKVKVTGKGDNMTTEVVPVSINVGKYNFSLFGKCSADPETGANRIANISGSGLFNMKNDTVITGKVNGTDVWVMKLT